jgi:hypothetical protein
MCTESKRTSPGQTARLVCLLACLVVALGATGTVARADNVPSCVTPASAAYSMELQALTGPQGADARLAFTAAQGCAEVGTLKNVQLKIFAADGSKEDVVNLKDVPAPGGVATIDLGHLERAQRITAHVLVQTGTPERTYVVLGETTTKLRPDLAVEEITPQQALVNKPVFVTAVIRERNGDVGAKAVVSLSALPGSSEPVVVPAGGQVRVKFAPATFGSAVPLELTVKVDGATPAETDTANNERKGTLDVTEHQLPTPRTVLFPSLLGYGLQFNNHLYAPVTPWPAGQSRGNVEEKVKTLQPHLARIFYNDNWDGNWDGRHPEWQENYASFVKVVRLAQEAGATIDISFQNLGNARFPANYEASMAKFADVLEDLVRNHGLTNVRWAEVGNEPNSPTGAVTLENYSALVRALDAQLVARGLRQQIRLMGGGLIESNGAKNHYEWMKEIAADIGHLFDGYAEHVYWWYDNPGRLEYRLRDTANLMNKELPAEQRKPTYMMEFGIRGFNTCGTKPVLPAANHLYYRDESCTDIWRTNIAGFQQLWFNIDSAQLGVAGSAKWDAYWGRYDNSSVNNQLYWMIGPPTEGSPLTPTYHALSLLFHTTVPGWQILGLEPWEENDWSVPAYGVTGGATTNDQPEKELVAYAGPAGELTIVGLDTHGKGLNTASTDPPVPYSIGGLPPSTAFRLALWNATGDGTNSLAGTLTTNAAGVVRFEVPLHAAFALTTVPVA